MYSNKLVKALLLVSPIFLSACGGDDDDDDDVDLSGIESQLAAIETRLSAIENDSSATDSISGLNTSIGEIETSIADIEARILAVESDTTSTDSIAQIQSDLDALNETLDTLIAAAQTTYEITIVNATNGQPLSPPAVLLHNDDYAGWSIGTSASPGLEDLAESGSPDAFIAEAATALDSNSGATPVGPGSRVTLNVTAIWNPELQLTVASMLVNTNDAFSGTTGRQIGQLTVGDSIEFLAPIYDAGTEFNSETAATIPGPAANGEGFNAERETSDQVTRHPGVVTQNDGYAESVLTEAHKFDNGSMLVRVRRVI